MAGPNGAGKSTYATHVLLDQTGLPFVNADVIAAERWPGEELGHAHEASRAAAGRRAELMTARRSFVTETVFSHPSKLDLLSHARAAGYRVHLHVVMVPEELSVARVASRVAGGGHDVPEDKIRVRWRRLWPLVADGIGLADEAIALDSSRGGRFREVAVFRAGRLVSESDWPDWTPAALRAVDEQWPGGGGTSVR